MKEDVFRVLIDYADLLAIEKNLSWWIEQGSADLGRIETFSGGEYRRLVYHLAAAKRGGLDVEDTQQAISSFRKKHEANARRVWDARDDKGGLEQALDVFRCGLVDERDAVMDFAKDFATPHGLLAFARDKLQHYLDAIYPMDGESGERKRLTVTEDNFDWIGDKICEKICDPKNDEYYIPRTPLLCVVGGETTKGLLGDGVADALWKMYWELKGAGDNLGASLCEAERGQIDVAYSKILRLVENDLGYLNGLLTKIEADAAAKIGTAAADAPMVANPAPSKKKQSNRRVFPQESMAKDEEAKSEAETQTHEKLDQILAAVCLGNRAQAETKKAVVEVRDDVREVKTAAESADANAAGAKTAAEGAKTAATESKSMFEATFSKLPEGLKRKTKRSGKKSDPLRKRQDDMAYSTWLDFQSGMLDQELEYEVDRFVGGKRTHEEFFAVCKNKKIYNGAPLRNLYSNVEEMKTAFERVAKRRNRALKRQTKEINERELYNSKT